MHSPIEEIKHTNRLLLNKYLDENKDRLNFLSNRNNHAILALDLDGSLIQVNPFFEELLGFSSDEAVQMRLQTLIPIEDLDKVLNYFHKSVLGRFETFDCKMTSKMNEIIDTNVMTIPLSTNDQIIGVYWIVKDITSIKRKDDEVRKIEEIHRVLTDHVLDIIVSTNYLGEIQYVSPSCKNILGYSSDELNGMHISSLIHKDDYKNSIVSLKKVLTLQENGRGTYRLRKKDGSYVWVEILFKAVVDPDTKNIYEVVSAVRDISEQKRAEEDLRKRKKAFREIIEHSPDGVVIIKNYQIQYINETGIRLFGALKENEIINKSILDFIHPDYHQYAIVREKSVSSGEAVPFFVYRMLCLDGTAFEAEVKSIPTIFENDEAIYVYIRDITERKKTQKLLFQAEKLNIAGQLAASIAHEIRNPLTAIKGFMKLMESDLTEKKNYFDIVQSEMGRIELILSELLALAKPKVLNIDTVELHALIIDVKTLIEAQATLNNITIDIRFKCQETLPINCDKNELKQVMINCMKNSIEAMENGGEMTVEIHKYKFDKIKILIKDTGTGIPPHILKRIGEPFFTTKENGTGLGIMISKQIIENHNGTLQFLSCNEGTTVEIILPIQ